MLVKTDIPETLSSTLPVLLRAMIDGSIAPSRYHDVRLFVSAYCLLTSDSSQSFSSSIKLTGDIVLMSRASIALTGSRRLSREGSTHNPHNQSAHLDEQPPPENDGLRPADE